VTRPARARFGNAANSRASFRAKPLSKLNKTSGKFMAVKKDKKFKGVRREKAA
jgi:hypothetical protein